MLRMCDWVLGAVSEGVLTKSESEYSSSVPVEETRPRVEILMPCFCANGSNGFFMYCAGIFTSGFTEKARTTSLRPFLARPST